MVCHSEIVTGERGIKSPVHQLVHRAVHQGGQCSLHITRRMHTVRRVTLYATKTVIWAGATPLLTAFSRPNQSGVAPARHAGSVTEFWPRAYRDVIDRDTEQKLF